METPKEEEDHGIKVTSGFAYLDIILSASLKKFYTPNLKHCIRLSLKHLISCGLFLYDCIEHRVRMSSLQNVEQNCQEG